jgi:hypothetical protein
MKKLTDADYEKFNLFIFSVDDSVEELQLLAKNNNIKLDFSDDTPMNIESLIVAIDLKRDDEHLVNVFGQYLGEYFIKKIGGQWKLGDDPESSIDFNQPVIGGHNTIGYVFSPLMRIRTFANRRKPGIIATSIEAQKGIDTLSHLTPEE